MNGVDLEGEGISVWSTISVMCVWSTRPPFIKDFLRLKQMSLFSLSLYGELNIFSFEFFIRYIIKFVFIINLSRYIADIFFKKKIYLNLE